MAAPRVSRGTRLLPTYFQKKSSMLRIKGANLFQAYFSPENLIPYVGARYISDFDNPIRPKVFDMYQNRERGILWWTVAAGHMVNMKRVVRSWCARRVRIAFRAALKESGYDSEGRKYILGACGNGNPLSKEKALMGTLEVRMCTALLKAKPEALTEQIKLLIRAVEDNQVGRDNGQEVRRAAPARMNCPSVPMETRQYNLLTWPTWAARRKLDLRMGGSVTYLAVLYPVCAILVFSSLLRISEVVQSTEASWRITATRRGEQGGPPRMPSRAHGSESISQKWLGVNKWSCDPAPDI
ncbi:predicted protein [Uncinocarpus reesii 1704]|uniref:Uncharacterized protein n=1 Tax=Uncinocarpus reesii (strain UAMH 1704) TaxID=336963 RepID=C4JH84_UNCRE|nr:uncharacterized protein UREG_02657 [Uncinocarpus reesii 1704]EEP77808.1 predicted protein [Uncinocarpus reesii 1704]